MKHIQPLTPAALYARVSSGRQDVDLSVAAQLRALRHYAKANGYSVAREYIDEAESGRVSDRPQFREMNEEGSQPKAPFEVILVWKFSRFTRHLFVDPLDLSRCIQFDGPRVSQFSVAIASHP